VLSQLCVTNYRRRGIPFTVSHPVPTPSSTLPDGAVSTSRLHGAAPVDVARCTAAGDATRCRQASRQARSESARGRRSAV